MKKPNAICKSCKKEFYQCYYCLKTQSKFGCCSLECAMEYQKQVTALRAKKQKIDLLPDRLDMSKDQILTYITTKTHEEAKADTLKELSDYQSEIQELGILGVVEQINQEIKSSQKEGDA